MKKIKKLTSVNNVYMYIYGFMLIYTPLIELWLPFKIIHLLAAALLFNIVFFSQYVGRLLTNKYVYIFYTSVAIATLMFFYRSLLIGEKNIDTNILLFAQTFNLGVLVYYFKGRGYTIEKFIRFILNIAMIQAAICIFMFLIPELRQMAIDMYLLSTNGRMMAGTHRIYGFTSDYTYSTPIYHGMLCTVALILGILNNTKYLLYIPPLLLVIFLNGRTGIIIFVFGAIGIIIMLGLRNKYLAKLIKIGWLIPVMLLFSMVGLNKLSPGTFEWVINGIKDTRVLFSDSDYSGNYTALFESMVYIPKGMALIWGEGHRVFGEFGIMYGYTPSDIGYVNDLFKGGLIYITILYSGIYLFCLSHIRYIKHEKELVLLNKLLSMVVIVTLLVGNYKGECMRSGIILAGIFYLKLALQLEFSEAILEKKTDYLYKLKTKEGGCSNG